MSAIQEIREELDKDIKAALQKAFNAGLSILQAWEVIFGHHVVLKPVADVEANPESVAAQGRDPAPTAAPAAATVEAIPAAVTTVADTATETPATTETATAATTATTEAAATTTAETTSTTTADAKS